MRYAIMLAPIVAVAFLACGGESSTQPTATTVQSSPTMEATAQTLAFFRNGDIWLIDADGSNERRLTHLRPPGREFRSTFRWLANGQRIAYDTINERPANTPPFVLTSQLIDIDGTVLWERELPYDPRSVLWSPDGQLVAIRDEARVRVEDRSERTLWSAALGEQTSASTRAMAWSPDSTALAFVDGDEIVVLSDDPLTAQRLDLIWGACPEAPGCPGNNAIFGQIVFSPDSESLVVPVSSELDVGASNIFYAMYRLDLEPSPSQLRLFPPPPEENVPGFFPLPAFSPDGRYVAHMSNSHLSACEHAAQLVLMRADASDVRTYLPAEIVEAMDTFTPTGPDPLRTWQIQARGPGWSPSGDAMVVGFQMADCSFFQKPPVIAEGIYIVSAETLTEEKLADEFPESAPVWSPSGRLIAYEIASPGQPTIRLLDLTTGEAVDLTRGSAPAWQPQP